MSHAAGPDTPPGEQDSYLRHVRPPWEDTQVLDPEMNDEPGRGAETRHVDDGPYLASDGYYDADDHYAGDDFDQDGWYEEEPVARGFGGPLGAFLALLTSAAIAAALVTGPSLPARADSRGWAILLTALDVDGPRTLATWWGVVLMTLTAVWCWAAAGRARWGRRWLRWAAWGLLGLVVLMMSASHLLALHSQVAQLDSIKRLGVPQFAAQHPVELIIAAALALPSLILFIGCSGSQRTLLLLGAATYLFGTLVIGSGRWTVSPNGQYQHVAEVAFEWCGIALVMLAAGLERIRYRYEDA